MMDKNTAARFAALILAVGGGGYYLGYDADADQSGGRAQTALMYEKPRAEIHYWVERDQEGNSRVVSLVSIPKSVVDEERWPDETFDECLERLNAIAKQELEDHREYGPLNERDKTH